MVEMEQKTRSRKIKLRVGDVLRLGQCVAVVERVERSQVVLQCDHPAHLYCGVEVTRADSSLGDPNKSKKCKNRCGIA